MGNGMGIGMNYTTDFHQPENMHKCGPNDPDYLCGISRVMTTIAGYIFPWIAALGVLFNCLSFFVFVFKMDRKRLNIYLAFLALADNLCLIVYGWLWYFPAKTLPFLSNKKLFWYSWNHGAWICKGHRFGMAFVSTLATTAQLTITVDRCLSIYFPMKFANMSNKKAYFAIAVVFIVTLVVSVPFIFLMGYSLTLDGKRMCYFADMGPSAYGWQVINVLFNNCGLIPVCSMIVVNFLLMFKLIQYKKERAKLTEGSAGALSSSEISASMLLVILSCIMIIGSVPQMFGQTLAMFVYENPNMQLMGYFFFDTGSLLFFIQESINFLIYMWRMKEFRKIVLTMFGLKSILGRSTYTSSMENSKTVKTTTM